MTLQAQIREILTNYSTHDNREVLAKDLEILVILAQKEELVNLLGEVEI